MGIFSKDVYGEAALVEALEGINFPVSTYQLMEEAGDRSVQWFKEGEALTLSEIIGKLDYQVFESPSDVAEVVARDITVI